MGFGRVNASLESKGGHSKFPDKLFRFPIKLKEICPIPCHVRKDVINRNGSVSDTYSIQKPAASKNLGLENDGFLRVNDNSWEGYHAGGI